MKEYNISWTDAMNLLLEGKWLKGNKFAASHYIKLDHCGQFVLVDVGRFSTEIPYPNFRSLASQTYRIITVATIKELND